jgi:uncharacterized protein (TIGR03000 family)
VPEGSFYGNYYSGSYQQPLAGQTTAGFTVRVPDPNAEIWFQDYKTRERGMVRDFQSDTLQVGKTYTFHIRARWMQNGQPVEQSRDVPAQAGQQQTIDFTKAPGQP